MYKLTETLLILLLIGKLQCMKKAILCCELDLNATSLAYNFQRHCGGIMPAKKIDFKFDQILNVRNQDFAYIQLDFLILYLCRPCYNWRIHLLLHFNSVPVVIDTIFLNCKYYM